MAIRICLIREVWQRMSGMGGLGWRPLWNPSEGIPKPFIPITDLTTQLYMYNSFCGLWGILWYERDVSINDRDIEVGPRKPNREYRRG